MKIQNWKRLNASQLEAPEWMDRFLASLNEHLENITTALQSRLTASHNLDTELRTIALTHDVTARISLERLRTTPIGVLLLWTDVDDYARLKWTIVDQQTVDVTVKWDTDPGTSVSTRLMFLGG